MNDLDYGDIAVEPGTQRKLTGLIHVLIDAKTGPTATTSIEGIDECEAVADLEGELVTRFTREWGTVA